MIRQDRSFAPRSDQVAVRRARKWAFTVAALLVGSWWPGAAQQRAVVTPSPAVGVQTYQEGNYQVHIFENQGARDVPAAARSVLVLGFLSGPGSTLDAANYINPDTGRRFDVVIGLKSNNLGSELVRILRDHGDAGPNAAAVKSAIAQQFQGPLAAGTVTMHSNGNPVGITDVLNGAITGVKRINMVEPDIGYGGKYVSEGTFQQLKTTGVNTINIYRNPPAFVTRLGELSAAIGEPIMTGSGEAVNAVSRTTMGMNLVDHAVTMARGLNEAAAAPNSPNRPTVNVFEVQTQSGSSLNPLTRINDHLAQQNLNSVFGFKNDTRVITPLPSQSVPTSPKGVHILIREEVLAKALSQGTPGENLTLLDSLGAAIRDNRDEASVQAAIEKFCDALKVRFKNGQNPTQLRDTVMVSLRTIADRAAQYVNRWNDLPEALRYPGGITRIHGYVVVPERNDVVLIGIRGAGERIELDDLIVGLKAVWQDGKTPFCSLDPDPQAIDGPQTVRVDGVPSDSGFALKMLDADYLMKRILLGLEPPRIDRYDSYRTILARSASARLSANRFWAYPFQPQAGEIQISPDMHEALYSSGVQILTEEMMRTQDGFTGVGAVNPEAEEAATVMTARFSNLATQHQPFQRLQGLFDIVLTARPLRHTHIASEALDLLVRLPRATVRIAPTYQGLKVSFQGPNRMIVLGGGVHAKANATDRSLLSLTDSSLRAAALTARAVSERSMVATDAVTTPFSVVAPDPTRRDRAQLTLLSARAKLKNNDPAGALNDINLAIKGDEGDPELRAFRAIVSLSRGDVAQARTDSLSAQLMDPDNPQVETITSTILFQCDLLEGKPDLAMQWIERSLRSDPYSASAHTRRAEALLALDRAADARAEFRKAMTADPTSALAVARLARLEIAEGWLTTGRRLVQKANDLAATLNQRIPEVQVAQAEAALALAFYGNVRSQIAEASRIAEELLTDNACDLPSALGAYRVLVRAALLTGDFAHADALVIRARGVSPTSPSVLIEAASTALHIGRADMARKYITEALTMAPNNVALLELNRTLAGKR